MLGYEPGLWPGKRKGQRQRKRETAATIVAAGSRPASISLLHSTAGLALKAQSFEVDTVGPRWMGQLVALVNFYKFF